MDTDTIEATHVVAKPFHTASRRFAVGAPIGEADVPADNPMSWSDLKSRRFVVGADTQAAERAEARAETEGRDLDPPPVVDGAPETVAESVRAAADETAPRRRR